MIRTKEQVLEMYAQYVNGKQITKIDAEYKTDSGYLFKKYKLPSYKYGEFKAKFRNTCSKLSYDFKQVSNETEAYMLGFWIADGTVSHNIASIKLHNTDKNILECFNRYVFKEESNLFVEGVHIKFSICSKNVVNNLIDLGCLRNKTYKTLQMPKIAPELIRHFLRGFFDGDGSVISDGKYIKCNFCSIDSNYLSQIQEILALEDIFTSLNKEVRKGKEYTINSKVVYARYDMYRLFIRRKEALIKFYSYLYKDSNIFLGRKKDKLERYINTVLTN